MSRPQFNRRSSSSRGQDTGGWCISPFRIPPQPGFPGARILPDACGLPAHHVEEDHGINAYEMGQLRELRERNPATIGWAPFLTEGAVALHTVGRAMMAHIAKEFQHGRLASRSPVTGRPDMLMHSHRVRIAECRAAIASQGVVTHSAEAGEAA